jgi:prevent-host-death family protein
MEMHGEEVGVRHLKAHLAQYLRRVRAGARLTITDRGRPIATLAPVDEKNVDWAAAMVAERRAHWGGGKPRGMSRRIPSRGRPASAMVLEDRR